MTDLEALEELVDLFVETPHGILSRAKPLIRRRNSGRRRLPPISNDRLRAAEAVETQEDQ
jgi:hypothetical protein